MRRQADYPPLQSRENKYTPPARRAPTGHTTVKGAPVDPAIISSQLKAPTPKQQSSKSEENKAPVPQAKPLTTPTPEVKVVEAKLDAKAAKKANDSAPAAAAKPESDPKGTAPTPLRPSATTSRTISPQTSQGNTPAAPSAAATVEKDVLASFKTFASKERAVQEKVRSSKARADKEVKLHELKKFGETFKLSTPVPKDLISIIAKDPVKQKAIQDKALQDAEAVRKEKAAQEAAAAVKPKQTPAAKETQAKVPTEPTTSTGPTPAPTAETRATSRPSAQQHSSSPSAVPGRHPGARQPYAQQQHYQQSYRGNRQSSQFGGQQPAQAQGLGQRIRANQPQYQQHLNQHMPGVDNMRPPPTGPANGLDQQFGRRGSGAHPAQFQQGKLNPNMPEFRPNAAAFAPSYAGPSQTSSPRSAINTIPDPPRVHVPPPRGQLVRRKTKAVDVNKCNILRYLMTLKPQPGVSWDENLGLRPSFQTPVTWRAVRDDGSQDGPNMHLEYKEWFDGQPLASAATATPNPQNVAALLPHQAHQHQLPGHLQMQGNSMAPRPPPQIAPMMMQNGPPGPMAHVVPYTNHADEHNRMVQSNSAQSFSPRMPQPMPMMYGQNFNGNSPGPMYMQPVQQQPMPYVNNAAPPMNYRSFSSNSQFMNQQPQMGHPMMTPGPYMQPNPMVQPGQMPMYPGAATQFIPGAGPMPPAAGPNGYPSPGRQAAPMMAQQGSQQGQPMMYGPSPAMNYQQLYQPQPPPNKYQGQRP